MNKSISNASLFPCPSCSFVVFLCWRSLSLLFPPSLQPTPAWCVSSQDAGSTFRLPLLLTPHCRRLDHVTMCAFTPLFFSSHFFFPICTDLFMLFSPNKSDAQSSPLESGNNQKMLHFTLSLHLWNASPVAFFYLLKEHEAFLLFHLLLMLMIGRRLAKGNLRRG